LALFFFTIIINFNTSVNIKNFPLDSFKQWFNRGLGGKTSIKLLTKSKAEQDKKDPELLYAILLLNSQRHIPVR
jgi:hypothetical protein